MEADSSEPSTLQSQTDTHLIYSTNGTFRVEDPLLTFNPSEPWSVFAIKGHRLLNDLFLRILKKKGITPTGKRTGENQYRIAEVSVPIRVIEVSGDGRIVRFQLTGHAKPQ